MLGFTKPAKWTYKGIQIQRIRVLTGTGIGKDLRGTQKQEVIRRRFEFPS